MFVYVFKIFLNFRISENQLKKQAMSAAERKRNKRKRKMEIEKYRKSQRTKTDVFNFTFCLIFYLFQKHDSKEPSLYCNICITFFDI